MGDVRLADAIRSGLVRVEGPSALVRAFPGWLALSGFADVERPRVGAARFVIRAYRKLGVDLQVKVHEDMKRAFRAYPRSWGLQAPEPSIDHRRVPNLQTFFRRAGAELVVSRDPADYRPGDLVTWMLPGNLPHIGITTGERSPAGTLLVVHNIGRGPELEDILFRFPITGHYRYAP